MGKTCRFVVNAVGKGGETYYTHFNSKQDLDKWVLDNREKLSMDELKIVDKHKRRNPILRLFNL